MNRSSPFLTTAICAVAIGTSFAGSADWSSDFESAKAIAAEKGQSLLIDFTGSDWCRWCIKLNEEVFSKDAFKEGVKDKFVLVEIDYPRDASKLSAETKEQNANLQERYGIRGYPLVLLTDEQGRPFGVTGYQEGGAETFVKQLDALLEKRKERDSFLSEAEGKTGEEKASALVAALECINLDVDTEAKFYGAVISEITDSDPDDATGYASRMDERRRFAGFMGKLDEFARKGDHEGALKETDAMLESGEFKGEDNQKLLVIRERILERLEHAE